MSEALLFDTIIPAEERLKLADRNFVLREASRGAVVRWKDAQLRSMRMSAEGKPQGMDGFVAAEFVLLSSCLFEVVDKGELPVSVQTISSWPNQVVEAILERLKRISHIDEETVETLEQRIADAQERLGVIRNREERLKNLLNGSTVTSGSRAS